MNDFASPQPLSPSLRPLPRMSCRPGASLVRIPTNPAMPCAGVEEDVTRRALRSQATLMVCAALPLAFAAAAILAGMLS